jgi:hypothetical protein
MEAVGAGGGGGGATGGGGVFFAQPAIMMRTSADVATDNLFLFISTSIFIMCDQVHCYF